MKSATNCRSLGDFLILVALCAAVMVFAQQQREAALSSIASTSPIATAALH